MTFQDRQNITATFNCEDVTKTFECGERLRRTERYTEKATGRLPNGKVELDVESIRQATCKVMYCRFMAWIRVKGKLDVESRD